jgi:hypothetical protein
MRNGTPIVIARELARHSDINTTMRYTHIGLEDQAKGIENLPVDPAWTKNKDLGHENLQQIRSDPQCFSSDSGGFSRQSESTNGSECHQLTPTGDFTSQEEIAPCVTFSQRKCPSVTEGHKVEAAGFLNDFYKFILYNDLRDQYFLIGPVFGQFDQPNWTLADSFPPL